MPPATTQPINRAPSGMMGRAQQQMAQAQQPQVQPRPGDGMFGGMVGRARQMAQAQQPQITSPRRGPPPQMGGQMAQAQALRGRMR
jgi:hypothetical protein